MYVKSVRHSIRIKEQLVGLAFCSFFYTNEKVSNYILYGNSINLQPRGCSQLERSPHVRKVECSKHSRD